MRGGSPAFAEATADKMAGKARRRAPEARMVIAYHAIRTTYGTWLPNDPRGSYSKAVYNAELASLG